MPLAASYAAVLTLALFPIASLFIRGVQIFDIAYEFVAYRMGDALGMIFDDLASVRPVQGLPNALVSKVIVKIFYAIYSVDVVSPAVLQLYAGVFFVLFFTAIAVCLGLSWPHLRWSERAAIALIAILPWYIAPTDGLLPAPEYWFSEWAFLVISAAFIPLIARSRWSPDQQTAAAGMWLAIGISTKISMLGIAPLLLLSLPSKTLRAVAIMATVCGLTYLAIVFAYAGFRPNLTMNVLLWQVKFYINPNVSQGYGNVLEAVHARPIAFFTIVAAMALALILPRGQRPAALAWLAMYIYLLLKRPNDTSLASAAMGSLFIVGLAMRTTRVAWVIPAAVLLLAISATNSPVWMIQKPEVMPPQAKHFSGDILYIPSNNWNAAIPIQAFAYNGGLAQRPQSTQPTTPHTPAFNALFGPSKLMGEKPSEIVLLKAALRAGKSVVWTRPIGSENSRPYTVLYDAITSSGKLAQEERVNYHHQQWWFGHVVAP